MQIKKCCVCDTIIYPGENAYQVRILVHPEDDEACFDWGISGAEEIDTLLEEGAMCDSRGYDAYYNPNSLEEDEYAHEIYLCLCKSCKVRLLANPSTEAVRLLINLDPLPKIVH